MAALPQSAGQPQTQQWSLKRLAVFPRMRALAWAGDELYVSRGYELLRARIAGTRVEWQTVGPYRPPLWRLFSSRSRLASRLFRNGFHALALLPSGGLVAAVPGAIASLAPGESSFRVTHQMLRGTRPLHITAAPDGTVYWGEYFDNPRREAVHIYASCDKGSSWQIAYTFPPLAVRHVHNIVYDRWENCFWVLTGDDRDECRVLKASLDFNSVQTILSGQQQVRAAALIPTPEALYFSSDTPSERNHVYRLDRQGGLDAVAELNGSSIYGCSVGDAIFFSTMVEPSSVNMDRHARLYGSADGRSWHSPLAWQKDRWPMGLFQFGNIFLPDGANTTGILALTTLALKGADLETSLWKMTGS